MQHESPEGHQVGQWGSGRRRRAAPVGAGAGAGSALVARGEQILPEHPLPLPGGRGPPCFAGFQSQKSQTPLLLPLMPLLSKGRKEYEEDPCTASTILWVFCSQPGRRFCLVNQKNICVLLFHPAHQQTAAWSSPFVPAAVVSFCTEAAQMHPAVQRCPSSPPPREGGRCSPTSQPCTRALVYQVPSLVDIKIIS